MSEVKTNAFTQPLPDYARKAPLVFVTRWHILKENHDRMAELVTGSIGKWGMDTQRMHPDKVTYSRTRHWFRPSDDGKTEEWWFMDEYDSPEAFEAMQKMVASRFGGSDVEAQKARHKQLLALMVPGTVLEPIIYSEIESARIEFEPFRFRAAALARATALAGRDR
jgi:hypothetical protein